MDEGEIGLLTNEPIVITTESGDAFEVKSLVPDSYFKLLIPLGEIMTIFFEEEGWDLDLEKGLGFKPGDILLIASKIDRIKPQIFRILSIALDVEEEKLSNLMIHEMLDLLIAILEKNSVERILANFQRLISVLKLKKLPKRMATP